MRGEARWPLWGGEPQQQSTSEACTIVIMVQGVSLVLPDTLYSTLYT